MFLEVMRRKITSRLHSKQMETNKSKFNPHNFCKTKRLQIAIVLCPSFRIIAFIL